VRDDALGEALQRPGERQHPRRHLDAAEHGVFGGDDEVAIESQLEAAAECHTLDRGDGPNPQRLDRAIRQVDFGDESAKPIDVLARPFAHLAAKAEMRSLRPDHQNTDIAFAGIMDRVPKRFRELEVDAVERRIGENDAADGVFAFESDGVHAGRFRVASYKPVLPWRRDRSTAPTQARAAIIVVLTFLVASATRRSMRRHGRAA
jgi:hypothetical protein